METTLLLVDDEVKMLEAMASYLQNEGFRIVTATTGKDALTAAQTACPALVVLDWMLPGMSGIDVCRELRNKGNYGIIMLTAKTEETDKIVGLEVGADDYMTKPYSLRELTARIRSVLRRIQGTSEEIQMIIRGDLTIIESKCQVMKEGAEVVLTPTEFKLLIALAAKPGIVFSRLQLMKSVMEDDFINYERTIDSHISNLRKKIENDPAIPKYIQTVFGFGYRFGDKL
ncbi:Alkaline phosphatase synthesis transcriptional regulatory protein PhoP [Paenibacillus solanacearum]|uniref:Alkaline phosphatase synthesis transcriptional regulatory protein PhoP n=1 Tax=Paenibacillus solanacearum TaxID=2048548 RepID=A0A916K4H0_9BACL|nr:response regulator transcription factor [Paenibacillus solanacearum]CAG7628509.1 Alkaline phosphatase synthesis transcriptional regulatory protein PhoP [Paenibacillus solanacearum]